MMNDFQGKFDPDVYLSLYYKGPGLFGLTDFSFQSVHEFFSSEKFDKDKPIKVLEYSCGPVISNVIEAAGFNSEIVLAAYTEQSRTAIQQWIDRDPSAWDWSPYFKFIIETLEGKDEIEVQNREESLRKAIKAVVPCDITKDPPIAKGFEGPYDVLMSMLAFESGCTSRADYRAAIQKITPLLKIGGYFLIHTTIRNHDGLGFYHVGPTKFIDVCLSLQFVLSTLEESGFTDIKYNVLPEKESTEIQNNDTTDVETSVFFIATRSK